MFIDLLYSDIPLGWDDFFAEVKTELVHIESMIKGNYGPNPKNMFKIFYAVRPWNIKVFMLGHTPNVNSIFTDKGYRKYTDQGIAFSQNDSELIQPKNLKIIENLKYHGYPAVNNACKLEWAARGVFLINKSLSFDAHTSKSHFKIWKCFIIKLLRFIIKTQENVIFVFFEFKISDYEDVILNKGVMLQEIGPYDERFKKDSNLFMKINCALEYFGKEKIDWSTSNV